MSAATARPTLLLLTLLFLLAAPAAMAQGAARDTYQFDFRFAQSVVMLSSEGGQGSAVAEGVFHDLSLAPATLAPGAPVVPLQPHNVHITVSVLGDSTGWVVGPVGVPFLEVYPGQSVPVRIEFRADTLVTEPVLPVNVTARITTEDGSVFYRYAGLAGVFPGMGSFVARGSGYAQLAPQQTWDGSFLVRNRLLQPRSFEVSVADNPCNMGVGLPTHIVVDNGPEEAFPFTVEAPDDRLWYVFGDPCSLTLKVAPMDDPDNVQTVTFNYTVQGPHIEFPFVFNTLALILLLALLVLFLRRRKEKVEEEILGKPQKPWTIPVEQVYLRHLKKKDERAWYVVRHHLMEDEYRSAMLWYHAYRKATKGTRKRERSVLAQERAYARWKAKWAKRIAAPMLSADRHDAKLQRRLDRRARKEHRKATRKWRKSTKRIEAAAASQARKQAERHAKAVRKAEKKGLPAPPPPVAAAPDLPAEPALQPILLAQHKWAKKAARHRAKMARRQGDLEVKYEREDARYQARMERRIRRLAEDIDDPAFLAEHPGLGEPAGAPKKSARGAR